MKIKQKLLYTGLAATLILAACGTNSNNEDATTEKPEETVNSSEGSSTDNGTTSNGKDENTNDENTNQETEAPQDTSDEMADATLTESDEQPYAIKVLPDYTLTSEEPGRDSLYSNTNESAFMRIETKSTEDGLYDYLAENMQEVLKASSDGQEPEEVKDVYTTSKEGISNVQAYKVETSTGPVTGVLFEKGDMIVRLTIFDSQEGEYTNDFLKMGETIQ